MDRYAGSMPDVWFTVLNDADAREYRAWARDNYKPWGQINSVWHPVVRDECRIIDGENKNVGKTQDND